MSDSILKPAIALFRRDVGAKTTDVARQRALIEAYAARHGYHIAFEFTYVGASHEDLMASRAYIGMLGEISARRALTVIVASATTVDTDPLVQAVVAARLRRRGVTLAVADAPAPQAPAASPDAIVDRLFEISERFETDLAHVIEQRRPKIGPARRKNYVEMFPEAVSIVKSLHRKSIDDGVRTTLREMSAILAQRGHLNNAGKPYHPDEVRRMIMGPDPMGHASRPGA